MRRLQVAIPTVLAITLLAGGAAAQQSAYARPGAFMGLGASYEVPAFQGILTGRGGESWGFNAHGGYRFNQFVAAEGVYEYADEFGGSVSGPAGRARRSLSISTNMFAAGGKLILPLERFEPYLWGGFGFLTASGDAKIERDGREISASTDGIGFAGRIAGGFDFHLTEHVGIYTDASYVMPATGPTDLYYFSLGFGARYAF